MTILVEKNVEQHASDGVTLRADVYRPDDDAAHPVLLCRTPYGKEGMLVAVEADAPLLTMVEHGYAVVVQDCRGTGASDGVFRVLDDEGDDGVDAVEWCAAQPWSTGRVGMFGGSIRLDHAVRRRVPCTRGVRVIAPSVAPAFFHGDLAYRGGAFVLATALEWSFDRAEDQRSRSTGQAPRYGASRALLDRAPLLPAPELDSPAGAHYATWLAHPDRDDYWDAYSYDGFYDRVTTPALHVAGWYDLFLGSTIANYEGLRDRAATTEARANQQLVIGPWSHANRLGRFADRSFGPAGMAPAGLHEQQLALFDCFLRDGAPPLAAPVRIFVMGRDEWRDEADWPLRDTDYRPLYLHGGARLAFDLPAGAGADDAGADSYEYDPRDPVPTLGGATLIAYELNEGPVDQRANDHRADVLRYVSDALTEPLEVTGPVRFVAHVSCSTPDTDLTATLSDVWPDGRAILLTDGILRLRYRDSPSAPRPMTPGEVAEVEVDLWATSNVFLPGHRIRLDVSSSSFPRYDRNPNTGGVIAEEGEERMRVAEVTLHRDAAHPSHLVLPVIPVRAG